MKRYLVVVEDDVEPSLEGPFRSERKRVSAAREHRAKDVEKKDGLFRLDISTSGSPLIFHFVAWELDPGFETGP